MGHTALKPLIDQRSDGGDFLWVELLWFRGVYQMFADILRNSLGQNRVVVKLASTATTALMSFAFVHRNDIINVHRFQRDFSSAVGCQPSLISLWQT